MTSDETSSTIGIWRAILSFLTVATFGAVAMVLIINVSPEKGIFWVYATLLGGMGILAVGVCIAMGIAKGGSHAA